MKHTLLLSLLAFFLFIPARAAKTIFGLTPHNQIIILDNPRHPSLVQGPFDIRGLGPGQQLVAIDYRNASGQLYALAYNAAVRQAQLYIIDRSSYLAQPVQDLPFELDLQQNLNITFSFNPLLANSIYLSDAGGRNTFWLNADNGQMRPGGGVAAAGADLPNGPAGRRAATTPGGDGVHISSGGNYLINSTPAVQAGGNSAYAAGDHNEGTSATYAEQVYTNNPYNNQYNGNEGGSGAVSDVTTNANLSAMYSSGGVGATPSSGNFDGSDYEPPRVARLSYFLARDEEGHPVLRLLDELSGAVSDLGAIQTDATLIDIAIATDAAPASAQARSSAASSLALQGNEAIVFPNPAQTTTQLLFAEAPARDIMVVIIDMNGRVMRQYSYPAGQQIISMDLSPLRGGLYSIRVLEHGQPRYALKLLKYE